MKTLYLIRHAKSSWNDMTLDDFDRPLNKRGKRDAPVMAEWLKSTVGSLDAIISSSAKRAMATAKQFADKFDLEVTYHRSLYHAGEGEILSSIYSLDDKHTSAALFGHNPGFTYFANNFVDDSGHIDNVPTCGIVGIRSSAESWADFDERNANVDFFMYPKKLV